jgi:hypothetical protein
MTQKKNKISPDKNYTLKEISDLKLIPGVDSYASVYNLVTKVVPKGPVTGKDNRMTKILGKGRVIRTDADRLHATVVKRAWNKLGVYMVQGQDILNFISHHNL